MRKTEKNVTVNNKLKMALGSRDVMGYNDYQGTGFVVEGTGKYLEYGSEYEMLKKKLSLLTRVLEVTVTSAKQML